MKAQSHECTRIQEELLQLDLNRHQREAVTRILKHLESCDNCRNAVHDYDMIHDAVAADIETPIELDPIAAERICESIHSYSSSRWRWRSVLWPTVAAACLLLTLAMFVMTATRLNRPEHDSIRELAKGPSEREISQGIQAFARVSSVFDNRAGWIVLSEQVSDVGLTDQPIQASTRPVVVYLNLKKQGKIVSEMTLAMIPGPAAHLEIPNTAGRQVRLTLQAAPNRPQQLKISMEMAPDFSINASLNMEFGQPVRAAQFVTSQGNFELVVGIYSDNQARNIDPAHL